MTSNTPVTHGRVSSLDYLRGLAAFGILLYHMHLFSLGETEAASALAKVKIYGVAIFYILSGLTLYLVYIEKLYFNKSDLIDFYVKRVFRIVPLLWLVTILTVILQYHELAISWRKIISNITVLPGIVRPETFMANGAWSIGNELFFYLLFPFLIYIARFSKALLLGVLAISFFVFCYFTFFVLTPAQPLGYQWSPYVNPLNQVLFFVVGICFGAFQKNKIVFPAWSALVVVVLMIAVLMYPAPGEPISLVTGITRLILSFGVAVICFLFYKTDFSFLPRWTSWILQTLGEISYSVYLLHPLVFHALLKIFAALKWEVPVLALISTTIVLSVLVSYISYEYFEKPFIALGKSFQKKFFPKPDSNRVAS